MSARAITPDRRPLFGELKPNYFVATGLGSNGFTVSPILAFLITKKIQGVDLFGLNQLSKIDAKRHNKN
jgi:glycine/D-amino acid oxidase-like deaminating enzyme